MQVYIYVYTYIYIYVTHSFDASFPACGWVGSNLLKE